MIHGARHSWDLGYCIVTMENLLIEAGFTEHKRKDPGNVHVELYW